MGGRWNSPRLCVASLAPPPPPATIGFLLRKTTQSKKSLAVRPSTISQWAQSSGPPPAQEDSLRCFLGGEVGGLLGALQAPTACVLPRKP